MSRKRLTQIMPCLIPLRTWQRNIFYNLKMKIDKNTYADVKGEALPYEIAKVKTKMINENSGHDIIYQHNKVDNLKIISQTMNHVMIFSNEVFSFCNLSKNSKKYGEFKDGLILVDGEIKTLKGGGICHLSNLLHHLFLLSPLDVIERHGHQTKSFEDPDLNALKGIDATIISGWLDLKIKNNTMNIYQIEITFDDEYMYARLLSNERHPYEYEIINENLRYIKDGDKIYENVDVVKITKDKSTKLILKKEKLYEEKVLIEYKLSENVKVECEND